MKRKELELKIAELVESVLLGNDIELVDVEFVKEGTEHFLRVYIDKPGGVVIDDCEKVSRLLDGPLDKNEWIQDSYFLEVSSPGLERPLKNEKDFIRNKGKTVDVKLYQPKDGVKQFEGTLVGKENSRISIKMETGHVETFEEKQVAIIKPVIKI